MQNRDLIEEFSDLFDPDRNDKSKSCMYWGLTIGDGWIPIMREYLECCAQAKREFPDDWKDFQIDQVKQKWGRLTIYTSGGNHDSEIFEKRALERSSKTCECCGEQKELKQGHVNNKNNTRGVAYVCNECA